MMDGGKVGVWHTNNGGAARTSWGDNWVMDRSDVDEASDDGLRTTIDPIVVRLRTVTMGTRGQRIACIPSIIWDCIATCYTMMHATRQRGHWLC